MAHTFTNLLTHVVFSTKNRDPVLEPSIRKRLYPYMGGILKELHAPALIINGVADHVHQLISMPATRAVSDVLRVLKTNSSRWLRDTFAEMSRFGWQTGYGTFSVSQSQRTMVRGYIAKQEQHHRTKSFQEEFIALLERHGIRYDERYIWE